MKRKKTSNFRQISREFTMAENKSYPILNLLSLVKDKDKRILQRNLFLGESESEQKNFWGGVETMRACPSAFVLISRTALVVLRR